MVQEAHFRKLLPIAHTFVAAVFGGWGLLLRDSMIRNSLGWNSTLRFHVWPWPFKFAAILNMPALIVGGLVSWPLDSLRPGLPESVAVLPTLLFVPLLWYWVGSWETELARPRITKTVGLHSRFRSCSSRSFVQGRHQFSHLLEAIRATLFLALAFG